MKRNYRNLFMVGICAFLSVFASCDEEQPIGGGSTGGDEVVSTETSAVTVASIGSTSATFMVKDLAVDSLAYYVHEGAVEEEELDPIVLFSEAQEEGRIAAVVDNNCTFSIYSLEGNKEYTVYIMYTENDELVAQSATFMTASYDRLINVIESRKEGFTFHFNVPEGMTYMYAILPTENYNAFRANGWADDITFLSDGLRLTGPQTVTINSGEDWFEEGDGGFYIHPGSAYTLMIAECDEEGNILYEMNPSLETEEEDWGEEDWGEEDWGDEDWNGEAYDPMPLATRAGTTTAARKGAYTEIPWYSDDYYPTGLYARQNLLAALEMVESKVNVEFVAKTERRIKLRCTADEDVQYVIAPMEKSEYRNLVSLVSKDAAPSTLLEYYGELVQSGTQDLVIDENMVWGLEVGTTWIISVIGVYAEDASVISYDTLHVTLTPSTLPAAELTIEGCDNPYGDEPTPNLAWFRIKSESKNVASAKHIANYTKEVVKQLSYGTTYEDLISYYGEYLTEDDIAAINSDEGLYLSIYSMEDAATTLIVTAYNEDDVQSTFVGESRSAAYPALPEAPEYSKLAAELKGEWTARVIRMEAIYNEETWEYDYVRDTLYTTLSLGETFDNSPATFDENSEAYAEIYESYYWSAMDKGATDEEAMEIAKTQVEEQFAEYKRMVTKYEEKYKGQNYILGLGLEEAHTYATPWDLFCSSDYSAYDVEELFYAYGPKLFFQVQEDGSLYLLGDANLMALPPVAAWGWYEFVLVGNNPEDEYSFYNGAYPVEVVDENTLVIKGVDYEGQMCYPAIGFWEWGSLSFNGGGFKTIADIQLTRGAVVEEENSEIATRSAKIDLNKAVKSQNNRIKRTYLPTKDVRVKESKMTYIPVLDNIKAKYTK